MSSTASPRALEVQALHNRTFGYIFRKAAKADKLSCSIDHINLHEFDRQQCRSMQSYKLRAQAEWKQMQQGSWCFLDAGASLQFKANHANICSTRARLMQTAIIVLNLSQCSKQERGGRSGGAPSSQHCEWRVKCMRVIMAAGQVGTTLHEMYMMADGRHAVCNLH